MLTKTQVIEEEAIQERVRAKWNPNWREELARHRRTLGRVALGGRSAKAWVKQRPLKFT